MPARTASSTTYWIAGLSTTGSISLGWALVAGRNRVPSPAAGITAVVTGCEEFTTPFSTASATAGVADLPVADGSGPTGTLALSFVECQQRSLALTP